MTDLGLLLLGQSDVTAAPAPVTIPGLPGSATESAPLTPSGAPPQGPSALLFGPMGILLAVMVFIIVMSAVSQRKEKKRRDAMLGGLKRQDRVQTSGGIVGTVVELIGDEVVLRVDEASNTRIRFLRSAVVGVLREGKPSDKPGEKGERPIVERPGRSEANEPAGAAR